MKQSQGGSCWQGTSAGMAEAPPLCYHGAISRKTCEDLLGRRNKDGAYLIRDSETIQGAMCLCVYKDKVVYTYRLMKTHTGEYMLTAAGGVKETAFKSLDDLVRHYKRRNQGLATHLCHPVQRNLAILKQPVKQAVSPRAVPLRQPQPADENDPDQPDYVKVLPE